MHLKLHEFAAAVADIQAMLEGSERSIGRYVDAPFAVGTLDVHDLVKNH